jgi:hypothetical protein
MKLSRPPMRAYDTDHRSKYIFILTPKDLDLQGTFSSAAQTNELLVMQSRFDLGDHQ